MRLAYRPVSPGRHMTLRNPGDTMSEATGNSDSTFGLAMADLRRRRIFRVAAAYAVIAWVAIEASDVVLPALGLPDIAVTWVVCSDSIVVQVDAKTCVGVNRVAEERVARVASRDTGDTGSVAAQALQRG